MSTAKRLLEFLNVEKARDEVSRLSSMDIDTKSAYDWASRSIACFQLVVELGNPEIKLQKYQDGDDYRHEALEHASLGKNGSRLVQEVLDAITPHKEKAFKEIQGLLKK